jgi:hypothetical protein
LREIDDSRKEVFHDSRFKNPLDLRSCVIYVMQAGKFDVMPVTAEKK